MEKDYNQDEELNEFEAYEEFEEEFDEIYETDDWEEDEEEDEPEIRQKHRGLKTAAAVLLVIALAAAGVIYGFRLEEVRVIGNKNYTAEEIKAIMAFPENAPNTLFCYLRYFRYKVSDVPFVEEIRVKVESRNMLCIEVSETDILGCFKNGKTYYYFDDEGVVQEAISEKKEKVPLVKGAETGDLEIGAPISIENQNTCNGILELTKLLLEREIDAQRIEIDEDGSFTVYIDDGIRAAMGKPVLLEEKTVELANILPELRKMEESEQIQGILHLENYDSTKNSIIFTKEN